MPLNRRDLDALFAEEHRQLLGIIRRRVGDDHAADLLHDLFLRLDRIVDRLPTRNDARLYLMRMAHNIGKDHVRTVGNRLRLLDGLAHLYEDATEASVHDEAVVREELATLERGIAQLPPRQQTVMRRSRLLGETHETIARALGVSLRTVELDMATALKRLRTLLHSS